MLTRELLLLDSAPDILEASSEAIADINLSGAITGCNTRFVELAGLPVEQCVTSNITDFLIDFDIPAVTKTGSYDFVPTQFKYLDGTKSYVLTKVIPIGGVQKGHMAVFIHDPETIRRIADRLDYAENYDASTGLLNHTKGLSDYEQMIDSGPGGGCLLLRAEINANSNIENDTIDHYMKQIASHIPQNKNGLLIRYSHAEILYVFTSDIKSAPGRSMSIIRAIKEDDSLMNNIYLWVAHTCWKNKTASANDILSLLKSKYVSISEPGSAEEIEPANPDTETLSYAFMLEGALKKGELDYYIQPQICSDTRQIIGGELLIRWLPASGITISPSQFIDFFEEGDLADVFFEWSIKRTVEILKTIHEHTGVWIPLSLNLSPSLIHSRQLMDVLVDHVKRHHIPMHVVEVELTERILATDPDTVLDNLNYISENGLKIAIDDFGTGYSSLSYLRRFPIDRLKIDRIFISNLEDSEEDRLIATSIVSLAHVLGVEVVAEGVEEAFQASFLRDIGCEFFQGYLTGKPMPVADFIMLNKNKSSSEGWEEKPTEILKNKHIKNKSASVRWKKSFSTDVVSVDSEHRVLIDMLNQFIDSDSNLDEALKVFDEVTLETINHFKHEERIMMNIKYPRYELHREKHRRLVADITKYRSSINASQEANIQELIRYLKYWLLRHLVSEDTQLRQYLNKEAHDRRV